MRREECSKSAFLCCLHKWCVTRSGEQRLHGQRQALAKKMQPVFRPALIPGNTFRFVGHILPTFPIPHTPQLSYGIQSLASCLLFRKKTTLYQSPLVKNHIRMLLFACYQALLCYICSSTQLFIWPFISNWILFLVLEAGVQHRLEKVILLDCQLQTSAASRKHVSILFISA